MSRKTFRLPFGKYRLRVLGCRSGTLQGKYDGPSYTSACNINPERREPHMHAAAFSPRGGVSPRGALLRGQSIIEYVLIIAVIGLVVVFAGPGVAGAIRNQFSQVANTVDSGTSGDSFMSAEEKAYREAMKTVASKDAKDWTLDEQKAAATDIAKNGTSSVVYAKAKAAMDAGTRWSVKLTNGKTMTYRIIGINHDDLADGSGKAGLTFLGTTGAFSGGAFSGLKFNEDGSNYGTNVGGWQKSQLRTRLNSGDLWQLMPNEFASKIETVSKMTDNLGGGKTGAPTATSDKLFLLSVTEVYGDVLSDGFQYEHYVSNGVTSANYSKASDGNRTWTRSTVEKTGVMPFYIVSSDGQMKYYTGNYTDSIEPAFCF